MMLFIASLLREYLPLSADRVASTDCIVGKGCGEERFQARLVPEM